MKNKDQHQSGRLSLKMTHRALPYGAFLLMASLKVDFRLIKFVDSTVETLNNGTEFTQWTQTMGQVVVGREQWKLAMCFRLPPLPHHTLLSFTSVACTRLYTPRRAMEGLNEMKGSG